MSRLDRQLSACLANSRKILIPFITAGDPSLEATVPVMHALVQAGADVLELGVPFSDPMADGPVIQLSSEHAIARGAGLRFTLEAVREFRATDAITPVVLMGYLNPVAILGAETFARTAVEAGVDGVLLVDLPPEESAPFHTAFAATGLQQINLASPTTSAERLLTIAEHAEGYLYYVNYAGVTGAKQSDVADSSIANLNNLMTLATVPVVAGFGIRDAAGAVHAAQSADGVVIGSALVLQLAQAVDCVAAAKAFLTPIREALDAIS